MRDHMTRELIVDPRRIDLEARWPGRVWWLRSLPGILPRIRHQTATLAILAITAVLWICQVDRNDTEVIVVALALIAAVGIAAELVAGKPTDGESRRRRARASPSPHAAAHQGAPR